MDKKKGIIPLKDLERKEIEIDLKEDFKEHAWIQKALENAAPRELDQAPEVWANACELSGNLRLERLSSEYMLTGSLCAKASGVCSRCGDAFPVTRNASMRMFFEPSKKSDTNPSLSDGGDPDFIVLESDRIELAPILTEQILVQVPFAESPERAEDGTCSHCGKNPQFAGQVEQKSENSGPFSKLKDLAGSL